MFLKEGEDSDRDEGELDDVSCRLLNYLSSFFDALVTFLDILHLNFAGFCFFVLFFSLHYSSHKYTFRTAMSYSLCSTLRQSLLRTGGFCNYQPTVINIID